MVKIEVEVSQALVEKYGKEALKTRFENVISSTYDKNSIDMETNIELGHPQFPRITINPSVCFGKPCIRGMRFPVTTLLGYLSSGMSMEEVLADFPFLEKEDILEAFAFAARAMEEKFMPLQKARA